MGFELLVGGGLDGGGEGLAAQQSEGEDKGTEELLALHGCSFEVTGCLAGRLSGVPAVVQPFCNCMASGHSLAFPEREAMTCKRTCSRAGHTRGARVVAPEATGGYFAALVRDLMAPFLVEAERRGDADAARWVDYFLEHFRGGAELWHRLEVRGKSPLSLLEAAVERDPEDVEARKALAANLSDWFRYCLHELPMGVLFGFNGASIEECHILLRYLALFEEQKRFLGERERSADFLRKCERHFRGYADYRASPRQYTSYADYIAKRMGGEE